MPVGCICHTTNPSTPRGGGSIVIDSPYNVPPIGICGFAASLNDFSNCWCKLENVEPDALKEWKINIFKIIDTRISFYSRKPIFYPLILNLLFVILNKVSRIFI